MRKNGITIGILCCGAVLMMLGLMRGEVTEYFVKAINICLECIGIG